MQSRRDLGRIFRLANLTLVIPFLFCSCIRDRDHLPSPPPPPIPSSVWTLVTTPSPAADITAVGNTFWVCGADEMIASSVDGIHWKVHHQQLGGKTLLHIAFVDKKIGHAAGKNGAFLSTTDGGTTWISHNAGERVLQFSFADANHGIAALGPEPDVNRSLSASRFLPPLDATVKLTRDGGRHWEGIATLGSEDFKPFTLVMSVAALDASHFLALVNHPNIEDAYFVTGDGGKSWKLVHQRNDETNREFARSVFVHDGEYWAFGQQLLDRQKGGGYMVSMTRHSKDGAVWMEGLGSASELNACNAQGCYFRDGVIESLYGDKEQYWNLPQDGSMSAKWARVQDRVCSISTVVQCASAVAVEKPQSAPRFAPHSPEQPFQTAKLPFASDCEACEVKTIRLDPGINWQGRVVLTFRIEQDGSVSDWSEDGAPQGPLGALIEEQFKHWKFAAPSSTSSQNKEPRHLTVSIKCIDAPEIPTMDGCEIRPATE